MNCNNGDKFTAKRRGQNKNQNPPLCDVNVTVDGQGPGIMIPTILKPNKADITAGFKFKVLTVIKCKPTYKKTKEIVRKLAKML